MLNRRQFLAGAVAVAGVGAASPAPPPPSVILIAIDDLGEWMTGVGGARYLRTPNLDSLAHSGTRFVHAFSAAPVAQAGFDALLSGAPAGSANTLDKVLAARGYRIGSAVEGDMASVSGQLSSFLEQQKAGQPFCLIARYAPFREADKMAAKYTQPFANADVTEIGWMPAAVNATDKKPFADIVPHLREAAAVMAACDDQLPAVQAKLIQRGLIDNTLIVLAGTSGVLLGRHGLWGDGRASTPPNMFDEVVGVPLIWNWAAGVPAGGVRPEVVSLCDVAPTICELTGATVPQGPGRSLVHAVLDRKYPKKQPWHDRAYAALDGTLMARNARYKLVQRVNGPNELYDLANDPREQRNQYEDQQFLAVRADLARELTTWK